MDYNSSNREYFGGYYKSPCRIFLLPISFYRGTVFSRDQPAPKPSNQLVILILGSFILPHSPLWFIRQHFVALSSIYIASTIYLYKFLGKFPSFLATKFGVLPKCLSLWCFARADWFVCPFFTAIWSNQKIL